MFGINNLIEKTIKNESNRKNGGFEEVVYVHGQSNLEEPVKASPQEVVYGELAKDTERNYVVFNSMCLIEPPQSGDVIRWNGTVYFYEETRIIQSGNIYDVVASDKRNTTKGRRR